MLKRGNKFLLLLAAVIILSAGCGRINNPESAQESEVEKKEEKVCTDYLFVYFTGNGEEQETISFAVSNDGFNWKTLNNKEPVIVSEMGTKGLRDPFIIRSADGSRFYLLATDLCIASDGDWWKAQYAGSKSIMIWESEDLVNWSEQRMVKVNSDDAGCTWAPEAFYDESKEEYVVFFASRVKSDNFSCQRVYYVTTKDFYEFSEPEVWIDYGYDTIDTTVIKDKDTYYRFTKFEKDAKVILEKSDTLFGEWEKIESESLAAQEGVEGPCCFALNADDVYDGNRFVLLLDNYGGSGYYALTAKNLADGVFEKKTGYALPRPKPRHGTVIGITAEEYEKLIAETNKSLR